MALVAYVNTLMYVAATNDQWACFACPLVSAYILSYNPCIMHSQHEQTTHKTAQFNNETITREFHQHKSSQAFAVFLHIK